MTARPTSDAAADEAMPTGEHLHLDPATRLDVVRRLKSSRGHLDGILRMLEDPSVYCVDVLKRVPQP